MDAEILTVAGTLAKTSSIGIVRRYLRCGACSAQAAEPLAPGPVQFLAVCPNCGSPKINLGFAATPPEWWAANG